MEILFDNDTELPIDNELIEDVAVTKDRIHSLNKKHRGIDRPTDVLSFPLIDYETETIPEEGKIYLGDIVLCPEKAAEQSEEYGHSIKREIAFLTAHSMLHLLGYDHMTPEEEKIMFDKQEKILDILDIKR